MPQQGVVSRTISSLKIGLLAYPVTTRLVVMSCTLLTISCMIIQAIFHRGIQTGAWSCLHPMKVVLRFQWYRVMLYPFIHKYIMHLIASMAAFAFIGPKVEKHMGTMPFLVLVWKFLIWIAVFYLSIIVFAKFALHSGALRDAPCIHGSSPLFFALVVVYVYKFTFTESIHVYGPVGIPNPLAPWILFLFSLVFPTHMALSHFVGLATGYIYVGGLLEPFELSEKSMKKLEAGFFSFLTKSPGYVNRPRGELPTKTEAKTSSPGRHVQGSLSHLQGLLMPQIGGQRVRQFSSSGKLGSSPLVSKNIMPPTDEPSQRANSSGSAGVLGDTLDGNDSVMRTNSKELEEKMEESTSSQGSPTEQDLNSHEDSSTSNVSRT
eukprot:m.26219 g.26219  ORF g.26219 m.26219 type:complete len:377 (+) comp7777_c0_seq1:144-1274(+)